MTEYPSIPMIHEKAKLEVAEANLLSQSGCVVTVVSGFEWLQIGHEIVGRRLTMKDVCGDDSNELAAVAVYDSPSPSHKTIFFRSKELKQRHIEFAASRLSVREASRAEPEKEIEDHIAKCFISMGHHVEQQVRCGGGIVDIVDHTDMVIIECKAYGGRTSIMGAVSQLDRYLPSFPGYRGAVGLSCRPAEDIERGLTAVGISIITTEDAEIAMSGAKEPAVTETPEAKLADLMVSYIAKEHWSDIQAMLPAIKPGKLAAEFEKHIAKLGAAA